MSIHHQTLHKQLAEEGRCTLSLCRSNKGTITLTFKTHTTGAVVIEMPTEEFTDLMFGMSEVHCPITRVNANRKPSYPSPWA
jgi:hypothetical protein